jgi:uncharacterized membrane protein YkoI
MIWTILHVMVNSSALKQSAASILVLLFLLTSSLADNDHDVARRLRKTGDIVPVERILKTLGGAHDVRVLEITLRERAGRLVYSVEYIDPNGLVIERQYDAKSGALLETSNSE